MSSRLSLLAIFGLILSLFFVLWIYWPGHTGPALLDDRSSVFKIAELKEQPELAMEFVLGDRSGPLGRPVSMASFVLESLYFDGGPARSKQINIGLHLFNGLLAALLCLLLLREIQAPAAPWLALAISTVWMLSPMHISAVLYVVQRMAMLATTFMLLAMLAYVWLRTALARGSSGWLRLVALILSILLAIFSQENAIVIIPILLLLEVLWFQRVDMNGAVIPRPRAATLLLLGTGLLALLFIGLLQNQEMADAVVGRHYSLSERLLTEGRILWDYVAQLLWPDVLRMGLYHDDIEVSKSLQEPVTTLFSLIGWLLVSVVGLIALRWRSGRYLAFGGAWFIVGHLPESTVWPLELYSEHRNYFPSIGLFLMIGIVVTTLISRWPRTQTPLLVSFFGFSLILATHTSSQVEIWSSEPLIALNHVNAHPRSFRANADMARLMAQAGDYETARRYSKAAYAASADERRADYEVHDMVLACMVNESVSAERIAQIGAADPERPLSSVNAFITMTRLLQDDICPRFDRIGFANRMAELYLVNGYKVKGGKNIFLGLAMLENVLARYDNAYAYIEQFLAFAPGNTRGLLMKLHFTTALGKVDDASTTISMLQELDRAGKLTVVEQENLQLYLEMP